MVLWWMKSIQVRMDQLLSEVQEEMVEENEELPRPPQDIMVRETQVVVQVAHAHVGDMIQILKDPPTQ